MAGGRPRLLVLVVMADTKLLSVFRGFQTISLREKLPHRRNPNLLPLLIVHGATFGGKFFDLPRAGYSLMQALAEQGRPVYALDVRGYGSSSGGGIMDMPPEKNPPFARAAQAVEDISAAVDFILQRQKVRSLDLAGFSWGSVTSALYAGNHAEKVSRLLLYAPLYAHRNEAWLQRIADPADRSRLAPALGAYRQISLNDLIERWNSDLPPADHARYREPGIAELIFETLLALDPQRAVRKPASFRCPNGALEDLLEIFSERPLYDPSRLVMKTLLVRGEADTTSSDADARRLLSLIASSGKDYCVISPGSHFLCVEKNRAALYERMNSFFAPSR